MMTRPESIPPVVWNLFSKWLERQRDSANWQPQWECWFDGYLSGMRRKGLGVTT